MLTERLTFHAKYGHGDELAGLFKTWATTADTTGIKGARIYTDVTGPMFTVVTEMDFVDITAYASFFSRDTDMYASPEFQDWFAKMMQVTERGERQLYNMDALALG